jgi:Acetyltransferase (GNAT) domain
MANSHTFEFLTWKDMDEIADTWQTLTRFGTRTASLADYRSTVLGYENPESKIALVVVRSFGSICGMLPLVRLQSTKQYTIGERRVGSLRASIYSLVGHDCVGDLPVDVCADAFRWLVARPDCDLLELRDLELDGKLHAALKLNPPGLVWGRRERKLSVHWLIDLPEDLDEFLDSMSTKSRQTLRRKCRRLHESGRSVLTTVEHPDQVEPFLEASERISRTTYQWKIGQRLVNDAVTCRRYKELAGMGCLRCHLLDLDGKPCAFNRGYLSGDRYVYETPGFDPACAADSPGTVLLMYVLDDLMRNTSCRVFDFGEGGDDTGYKARFGNRSYQSLTAEVASRRKLYSRLLLSLQSGLNLGKSFVSSLPGANTLRLMVRRK